MTPTRAGRSGEPATIPILSVAVQTESDVVAARQRARHIAAYLGFDVHQQTKLATAVSEIARNVFNYGGGGRVEFSIEGQTAPQVLVIRATDSGPGIADLACILEGRYQSANGMGLGIMGARRLMDTFEIESAPGRGVAIRMTKALPLRARVVTPPSLVHLLDELASQQPPGALGEMRQQNRELLATLNELGARQDELVRLNRELEDTNRGVVALYAELDEKAEHLRRSDETKSRFLSNMSHEFRTPLNSILALTRLLLDRADGDLGGDQERQVFFIRKSAESLSELVNDLLDLAKVEAGKIALHPAEFEVKNLFGALRGMLRPLLANASVNLVFEEPEGLGAVVSDEARLSQILRNLISNALKFTVRGEVRVSARRDGGRVIFAVADTGIGIDAADLDRIFQEFTQLDSPIQRTVKGTGLGLPLSRKLAGLLGGSVSVESVPAVGSTFRLEIPMVYAALSVPDAAGATLASHGSVPTRVPILVLEDHHETRLLYESYLKGSEYHITPAATIGEARAVLENVRPRAILLDVLLAGENSRGLLAELKGRHETKDIPVLVFSNVEDPHKVYGPGADVYARKPVSKEWLLETLNRCTRPPMIGRRILLVDDDEAFRYLVKQLFAGLPHEFVEAGDGVEGLAAVRSRHPELIFLDLMMPRIDGFEMLEQLRSDPATRDIPVIVSSSRALSHRERLLLEAFGARILSKERFGGGDVLPALRDILAAIGLSDLLTAANQSRHS
ncbi:MAG TPA: ATP-binding protein [Candidatus Acidoferrales bacterium]|jgi:signal transduction histidine kinase/CheY-like chemotaxis protein|nr:ATP-binding protein [Candidatus Acidoferrales bacterium]